MEFLLDTLTFGRGRRSGGRATIRAAGLLLAATTLCAAPGAAQVARPEAAAFAEYDRICRNLDNLEAVSRDAVGAGWQAYEPGADSAAGRIVAAARTRVQPLQRPDWAFTTTAYRKSRGGRDLVLLLSAGNDGSISTHECHIYDFGLAAPPTEETIAAWANARPTQRASDEGAAAWTWEPGFRDGLSLQSVIYIDAQSPVRATVPGIGLTLMAVKDG